MSGWSDYYEGLERGEDLMPGEIADRARLVEQVRRLRKLRIAAEEHREADRATWLAQELASLFALAADQAEKGFYSPLYTAWLEVETGIFTGTPEEVLAHLKAAT